MNQNGAVVSWEVPGRLSWEAWTERVKGVGVLRRKLPWYVGDLVLYGESTFGEKASQLLNEFGYTERQLAAYRWVAKKFPAEDRCDLPWSWHQAAAALPKRERDKALTQALAGELNRAGIRALANGASQPENGSARLPTAKEAAFQALGEAMAATAKLFRGDPDDETWENALDELIAEAMKARDWVKRE